MAFGMLTSQWGILHKALPSNIGMRKQIAITGACVRLHNYYLGPQNDDVELEDILQENDDNEIVPLPTEDEILIQSTGSPVYGSNGEEPESLLHAGEHFDDVQDGIPKDGGVAQNKMKESEYGIMTFLLILQ